MLSVDPPPSTLLLAAILGSVALAARVTVVLATRSYSHVEYGEANLIAYSLATTGAYADAFGPGTGPSAHVAPIFPFILSVIYRLTGGIERGELVKQLFA